MKLSNLVMAKRVKRIPTRVKILQDDEKPAKRRNIRFSKMLRRTSKSQHESDEQEKLETMKKLEEEKEREMLKRFREEVRIEQQQEMERDKKLREENMRMRSKRKPLLFGGPMLLFDRKSRNSYSSEQFQSVKNYAEQAIDVFNQIQPIKYRVVDIIRADSHMASGLMVFLRFTAKPDDDYDDDEAQIFKARLHRGFGKPAELMSVEIAF